MSGIPHTPFPKHSYSLGTGQDCFRGTRKPGTIDGNRDDFEFEYKDAPGRKRTMHIAIEDLPLEHLWVICLDNEKHALEKA
jgi:hypothetical protein